MTILTAAELRDRMARIAIADPNAQIFVYSTQEGLIIRAESTKFLDSPHRTVLDCRMSVQYGPAE